MSVRTMRIFLLVVLWLFCPALVLGQGVQHANFAWALGVNNSIVALPGASVSVCSGTSVPTLGTACSPTTTIYTSVTLATTAPNPITADLAGNFSFWATPGNNYVISVSALGYQTYSYSWTATLTLGGNFGFTGPVSFFGGLTANSITDTGLTPGNCVQVNSVGVFVSAVGPCGVTSGFLIATGSTTIGHLASFSGPSSITNAASVIGSYVFTPSIGAPAFQSGTSGPPIPSAISAQEGISGTGVTNKNLNSPLVYWSRWDSSTNSNCQVGLIDACAAPVVRIDATNGNTGASDTLIGQLVNLWGFKGNTTTGQSGGAAIGIASEVADVSGETGNTNMRGMNSNAIVQGVPSTTDRAGFTRSVFASENDITNSSGTDCNFLAASGGGNYCGGVSIISVGANNSTLGLLITSVASAGKGFLTGMEVGGTLNVGLNIVKANSISTGTGIMSAAGGTYGYAVGGTSITPPISTTEALAVPTVGFIFEPKTVSINNDSIPELFRVFAGDTSHVNEWQVNARNANTTIRWAFGSNCAFTIGTNPSPCSSYADKMELGSNGGVNILGNLCEDNDLVGATYSQCLETLGTNPTANRVIVAPDGNSATVIVTSLTTTSGTSDNVTVQGMTSSGHCQLTSTNSSAASNYTSTYVSAKTTNQITVTHTGTSGMIYDIYCTAN